MSKGSSIFQVILKLLNFKKRVYREFRNPPRNTGTMDRDKFNRGLDLKIWSINGFKLITINQNSSINKHVVFLHGGAYIIEATSYHRKFMEGLAREHGLAITFIDYPKAPEHTFQTTVEVVQKAYLEITQRYPGNEFYVVGDSAGGGLGLALIQVLRDLGIKPVPKKTVLVSPWLDLTMSHELIQDYKHKDNLLPIEGLIYAGKIYSGGDDLRNSLLSPLYGDMSNLGKIMLIFGTNEVFYPDCIELATKLTSAQGTWVDTLIGENMMHDWIIFPFKESKEGLRQIAQFILAD